ncbi:hypothetical protein [Brasilonema bromeliae]|uniref:hypothetical protein n=1 Tax=Brasilonema bromeliae TaxID=383615 RepID=UPI001B7CF3DA|nr:hypothetical protein [Brasilonema bromeliae]
MKVTFPDAIKSQVLDVILTTIGTRTLQRISKQKVSDGYCPLGRGTGASGGDVRPNRGSYPTDQAIVHKSGSPHHTACSWWWVVHDPHLFYKKLSSKACYHQ